MTPFGATMAAHSPAREFATWGYSDPGATVGPKSPKITVTSPLRNHFSPMQRKAEGMEAGVGTGVGTEARSEAEAVAEARTKGGEETGAGFALRRTGLFSALQGNHRRTGRVPGFALRRAAENL